MSSAPHALSLEFREPHIDTDAGLDAIPPSVRGITFDFSGFPVTSIRRFAHALKCLILWSPNSYQEPLCPGAPLSGLPPLQPSRELRRRDGSRGRYDCFIIPQLVSNVHPYLALVHRASRVSATDEWYPAYGFPAHFWEDVPGRLDASTGNILGRMSLSWRTSIRKLADGLQKDIQTWLASCRYQDKVRLSNLPHTLGIPPKFDTTRLAFLLDRLEEGCSWDDGLERAVELQYDLRQRRAWLLWVQGCMAETRSCTELRRTIRLPANDDYVGFWVNGCSEETTMLLMSLGAPTFVSHSRDLQDDDVVERPSAWLQSSTTFNEYFFLHASSAIIGPSTPSEGIPPATWPYPSFSLHGQRGNTSPTRASNPNAANPTRTPSTLPALSLGRLTSYEHDDPEPIPTSEGRAVTPEPLIDAAPGKWTHWMEMDDPEVDNAVFFASTSKANVEFDGQRVVYDRQNRRQILLDDFAYPAGTTDPELYGFRLPERVFRQRTNRGWKIAQPSSTWAYHSMHVPKESRHKIGTRPVVQQDQVSAPSRKGKQAVRAPSPPRSTSPSEVSLGSPEREEPEIKRFPTRCLRVYNLELSAVNLAALARNDESLERAGVFLKEIIVGQGATWMRFDDDESPGLIWEWLEGLHPGVRVEVTSREALDDASRYSHDRWNGSFVDPPAPRTGPQERTTDPRSATAVPPFIRPWRWDGFVGHDEPAWGAGNDWGNPTRQWGPPGWESTTPPRGTYDRYVPPHPAQRAGPVRSRSRSPRPRTRQNSSPVRHNTAPRFPGTTRSPSRSPRRRESSPRRYRRSRSFSPRRRSFRSRSSSRSRSPRRRDKGKGREHSRSPSRSRRRLDSSPLRAPPPETIERRWGLPAGTLRAVPNSPKTRPDGPPSRAVSPATIERRWGLAEGTLGEGSQAGPSSTSSGIASGSAVDDRSLGERLRWVPQPPKPASLNPKKRSKPRGKASGRDRQKRRNVKANHEALRASGLESSRRVFRQGRQPEDMDIDEEEHDESDEDMEEEDA